MEELSDSEQIECAKSHRDIAFTAEQFAERRSSELADEFTRLEVQIATILLAFTGLFVGLFKDVGPSAFLNLSWALKFAYATSVFFLLGSLSLGLLHLKRKEKWWDDQLIHRFERFKKWKDFLHKEVSFKEARAYHDGTALGPNIIKSPLWTWVLQTICLAIAIIGLYTLFLIFLFSNSK